MQSKYKNQLWILFKSLLVNESYRFEFFYKIELLFQDLASIFVSVKIKFTLDFQTNVPISLNHLQQQQQTIMHHITTIENTLNQTMHLPFRFAPFAPLPASAKISPHSETYCAQVVCCQLLNGSKYRRATSSAARLGAFIRQQRSF